MATLTAKLRSPADFGLALQQARLARELTQQELARALGVSQSAISEIEGGKPTIHIRRMLELARLLGLEFSATWEDDYEIGG